MNDLDNPFSVTKATDFTDAQINEYWVKFNPSGDTSLDTVLNPTESTPKYVIGSKGCGKTHILKYLSFELQQIRHDGNVSALLEQDKYVGLYTLLGGLDSSRFREKNISEAVWKDVFEYYFELYAIDNLLRVVRDIFEGLNVDGEREAQVTQKILEIMSFPEGTGSIGSLESLSRYLSHLRSQINGEIRNAAYTRSLNYDQVRILFSAGDLIFGVPSILSESIEELAEVKFIFIFDEYEKLFEWQKIFINTLVWDRKRPTTFWVGARTYGYTTRQTQTGENMISGSEFEEVNLDELIQGSPDLYSEFAERLIGVRLKKYYERRNPRIADSHVVPMFTSKFQLLGEDELIGRIREKYRDREYEHLASFARKLTRAMFPNSSRLNNEESATVVDFVEGIKVDTDDNPLEQKYKLFRFYYLWSRKRSSDPPNDVLSSVIDEFRRYKDGDLADNPFPEIKDKRKKDLLAQLAKESRIKNIEYSGLDDFIELSSGNPRSLIIMLKKVIEFAVIRGERPLEDGGFMSVDSQYFAIFATAEWFYKDREPAGETGRRLYNSLKKLADYFIQERFSDKPTETTLSCFYVSSEELSQQAEECIELMKVHSVISESKLGRIDKNSGRKHRMFQITKTLAPYWNIPTVVRGSIFLDKDLAEAIFNYERREKFKALFDARYAALNAPDFLRSPGHELQNELFT